MIINIEELVNLSLQETKDLRASLVESLDIVNRDVSDKILKHISKRHEVDVSAIKRVTINPEYFPDTALIIVVNGDSYVHLESESFIELYDSEVKYATECPADIDRIFLDFLSMGGEPEQ